MNGLSVVIPSRNAANLDACVDKLAVDGRLRMIVVDDGLPALPDSRNGALRVIDGAKPFIFARNVNLGIRTAGDDDVILLNDDALLRTPGGFSAMQRAAYEHPEYGLIASTCYNVGNPRQHPHMPIGGIAGRDDQVIRDEPRMVCFVCVLIPRRTIDAVGLLDERFTGYGCDDDDYCLRVRNAGLKIGIFDGCFVDHGSLTSTFRGKSGAGDYRGNLEIFKQKWGMDNWGNPA